MVLGIPKCFHSVADNTKNSKTFTLTPSLSTPVFRIYKKHLLAVVLFLGKERNRTVTQASEWSNHELRNLLNFWFNSLGLLLMHHCTCMHLWTHYVHTQNSSSSSSGCLFSLDLTLPQRQTEPLLWQTNTVKKKNPWEFYRHTINQSIIYKWTHSERKHM